MLFCAPLKGNPPLSRHSLILATQAGPWRALSDLIHCIVFPFVCVFWTCTHTHAHFPVFQDWQDTHAIKNTSRRDVWTRCLFSGVVTATGELLTTQGIVILPAEEEEQEKSLKEGKREIPNIYLVSSEIQDPPGICAYCVCSRVCLSISISIFCSFLTAPSPLAKKLISRPPYIHLPPAALLHFNSSDHLFK